MKNKLRNWIKKLPLIRGVVKKINDIVYLQALFKLDLEEINTELDQVKTQFAQTKKESESNFTKLHAELSQVKTELSQTKTELSQVKTQFAQTKKESESNFTKLHAELSRAKAELSQRQKELNQTKNNLKSISKDIEYRYNKLLPPSEYEGELKWWYNYKTKQVLNIDDPKTFNEKIQWLKLYDRSEIKTRLADKYLVRDWVKDIVGEKYLIPLIGVWDNFEDIDFDKFPQQFVLKANHGCGWNIIVQDKETFDREDAKHKFDKWLHHNYAFDNGFELHYKGIKPKIIAEHYIAKNKDLLDYKYVCFGGEVKYIWIDSDRFGSHKRDVFDPQWNLLPMTFNHPNSANPLKRPKNLEKMIGIVEKLSKDFVHVRVDLYDVDEKIYFGEMTFSTESGIGRFDPEEYNFIWGEMIKLPDVVKN